MTTTKKTGVKAVPADEIKTAEQMIEELSVKQNDLLEARKSHKLGELVNPRVIKSIKKDIARLHTAIRAAELAGEKESK